MALVAENAKIIHIKKNEGKNVVKWNVIKCKLHKHEVVGDCLKSF